MKKLMISFIAVGSAFFLYSTNGNFDISIGYNSLIPVSNMRSSLNSAHGLHIGFDYKFKYAPFSVGADFGLANYGKKSEPIAFQFNEFSPVTHTDIRISNNVNHALLNTKFHFNKIDKLFNPYLSSGFGMMSYKTRLVISDPEDIDDCHPLVSEFLNNDRTWTVRNGVGVQIDMASLIKKSPRGKFFFDINVHHFLGGKVEYMGHINDGIANAYQNGNHTPSNHQHHQTQNNPRGSRGAIMADFVNTPTGEVHQHSIGELFENRLNKVGVQARFTIRF